MSVGAICFTSSGGCWVALVPPPLFFLLKKGFFFPYTIYAKKKGLHDLHPPPPNFLSRKTHNGVNLCTKFSKRCSIGHRAPQMLLYHSPNKRRVE